MRILDGLDALATFVPEQLGTGVAAHSVVAVGVFDGMHLGHQRVMHDLLEMSSELGGEPTVVTFANHPDEILAGKAPEPILSVPHRLRLLRRVGVQRLLLLTFDKTIRAMTASQFAQNILHDGLRTVGLLLGFDSALGKDREGTPARFRELGEDLGFIVREARPFEVDGQPVSSTAIRAAITSGDLDLASRLLGRWPSAFGVVVHGSHRGHDLGFPTANIRPESQALPPLGIYAVEILYEGEQFLGVANLGTRPTFADADAEGPITPTLEVHVLDEDRDLYGATLEVTFIKRLRGERAFADAAALKTQIAADVKAARQVLGP